MKMLNYISEKYESDERTYIHKEGDETVSSYRFFLLAFNSSWFGGWVVLN